MSDALNLEPGALVGGYTLMSRLGSGAMGSVWRVHDDGGEEYAMKILRDSLADDRSTASARDQITARERLRREAMALKKVNHPGVCGIVDMELDDSLAFIVTELIEGKNLRDDVAANGPYVADDLERLASKLMDAVRAVHAAGIVHRDIKPTNLDGFGDRPGSGGFRHRHGRRRKPCDAHRPGDGNAGVHRAGDYRGNRIR